jgi:3-phenylpropionate/cinnamic acid dioxygenase small subunit
MGAGSWESHHAITSLMYRYTECIDAADFAGLGRLFEHGQIRSTAATDPEQGLPGAAMSEFYRKTNKVHPDGTLRTRHLTSNVRVDVDEQAGIATARSCYVVFQATPKLPLQPIVGGRYEDRFQRVDGVWHFAERLIHVDQVGDLSEHLEIDLAAGKVRLEDAGAS